MLLHVLLCFIFVVPSTLQHHRLSSSPRSCISIYFRTAHDSLWHLFVCTRITRSADMEPAVVFIRSFSTLISFTLRSFGSNFQGSYLYCRGFHPSKIWSWLIQAHKHAGSLQESGCTAKDIQSADFQPVRFCKETLGSASVMAKGWGAVWAKPGHAA